MQVSEESSQGYRRDFFALCALLQEGGGRLEFYRSVYEGKIVVNTK